MKPTIDVTETKVFPFKDSKGKVKAFAQIVLNQAMRMTGLKIIEGANGLFVGYPSEKGKDGEFYSIYNPINRESRNLIQDAVLESYEKALATAS